LDCFTAGKVFAILNNINCNRVSAGAYCWTELQEQEEQDLAGRGRVPVGTRFIFPASSKFEQLLLWACV